MFNDIADSTRLKSPPPSGIGAAAYAELARSHDAVFRAIVGETIGAKILKDVGDGFMTTFLTASDAVRAALRFQFSLTTDNAFAAASSPIPFRARIGIHQGEVAVLDLDIHNKPKLVGTAADMAARIQSLALPGQILVSRAAFNDARQYVGTHPACSLRDGAACPLLRWEARGYYRFRGIDEAQEVFEVGADGLAPLAPPANTDKAWYVGSPDDEAMRGWRPASAQPVPGRTGWLLDRQLGEGGFGEVWLARHEKTKELRVFKFCFDPESLRSFRREITLFRLLREALGDRHDIARLHEFQLDRPPFHLESEYSELGDLANWAAAAGGIGNVPLSQRLDIVARTANAVSAAHSVGVLHKDIKPSNILMFRADDGSIRPRLADFGIGILTDRSAIAGRAVTVEGFTRSQLTDNRSSRTGTRMYSPPEQDIGRPFTIQGDVYSLGVLLYQLVVADLNRPLATGWERDVEDPLLREGIVSATMGDPQYRMGSALELSAWLVGLGATRTKRAQEISAARRLAARTRTTRWAIAGAATMAAATTIATIGYIHEIGLRYQAESAQATATTAKALAIQREQEALDAANGERRANELAEVREGKLLRAQASMIVGVLAGQERRLRVAAGIAPSLDDYYGLDELAEASEVHDPDDATSDWEIALSRFDVALPAIKRLLLVDHGEMQSGLSADVSKGIRSFLIDIHRGRARCLCQLQREGTSDAIVDLIDTYLACEWKPLDAFDAVAELIMPALSNKRIDLRRALDSWAAIGWVAGTQGGHNRYDDAIRHRAEYFKSRGNYAAAVTELREAIRFMQVERGSMAPELEEKAYTEELQQLLRVQPGLADEMNRPLEHACGTGLRLAAELLERFLDPDEVVPMIDASTAISPEAKACARIVAAATRNHSEDLNARAWAIVRSASCSAERYETGLRAALKGSLRSPNNPDVTNTLGVAEYRCGQFERAIATLDRSDEQYKALGKGPQLENAVFKSMALARLGRVNEATAELDRLRELNSRPGVDRNGQMDAFIKEAESVLHAAR